MIGNCYADDEELVTLSRMYMTKITVRVEPVADITETEKEIL